MSSVNLTDWQSKQVKLMRDDIGKCSSINDLVRTCREFVTLSSQPWYVRSCTSTYRKVLDDLRGGRPPRIIAAIDLKATVWLAHCRSKKPEGRKPHLEFLEIIKEVKLKFGDKLSHIVFADEFENGGWRYDVFPGFKSKRQPAPEEFPALLESTRQALAKWEMDVVKIETMEADDVLASIATSYALAGDKVSIVCNDQDVYQVIGPSTNLYWNGSFYTRETMSQEHCIDSTAWVDYLCLKGKNDVPGANGIGDVYAKKLLMTFGSYANCCSNYKQIEKQFSKKIADAVMEFEQLYPVCRQVHTLIRDLEIEVKF